jgi:hypothetical protein
VKKIGILLYADDIVLIVENENDLQLLIDILFPEYNIRLYDKNSESDYFFFPPLKSEYFFQQHWDSEYFFRKKP